MSRPAPTERYADPRWTSERYLALPAEGVLGSEDRVELLEGVIVAVAPQSPRHAGVTTGIAEALRAVVGSTATIRVQMPLRAGRSSVPEPDVAVVTGRWQDHLAEHPESALLVVEVAEASLPQDRLTKAMIYGAAGIPEYWLVNLRDDRIEIFRRPERETGRYTESVQARHGERVTLVSCPGTTLAVDDLLPRVVGYPA
jgi:Uma2 family endonuclease